MKISVILFFMILIILVSCSENINDGSNNKKTCKELNCLMGDCVDGRDGATCICNDNAALTEAGICSLNICKEQSDCSIFKNKICGVNNKCISKCKNDNDCIGEDEVCLVDKNQCISRGELYQEKSCTSSQYLDYISKECVDYCKTNDDCKEGKICNRYKKCFSSCESISDCPESKFENLCEYKYNYCVQKYTEIPTRYEIAWELVNRFIPDTVCVLPNKEYFTVKCGDYTVTTIGKNEWGVDTIRLYKTKSNLIEFNLSDLTRDEIKDFYRTFTQKVDDTKFMEDVIPQHYLPRYTITLKYWKNQLAISGELTSDMIVVSKMINWKDIKVQSHYFNFKYNYNKEIYSIDIPYIYLPDLPEDADFKEKLNIKRNSIEDCLKDIYTDGSKIRVTSRYLKLTENQEFPEIYFLISINLADYYSQKYYLIKETDFDFKCLSVQNAIDNNEIKHPFVK